jgi:glycogenin glucosyltransferase
MSKFAYVTFIIRNDSYLPGALVFAYALRLQKTKHDIVCIVSENISSSAIKALRTVYDDVIIMDELYVPHDRRHERQDRPFLFSRFQSFRLGKDGDLGKSYDKIIMADCDHLPLRNFDELFELPAPAGIINERKEYCMEYVDGVYIKPESVDIDGTWNWHQIYRDVPHGTLIPKEITDRVRTEKDNMGVNTSVCLFKPSMELYKSIMDDLLLKEIQEEISTYDWPEMQYITLKLSGTWTNIDLRYSSFNGYPKVDVLYGIHFAGLKPWSIKNRSVKSFAKFEDYQLWNHTFLRMMEEYPSLNDVGKLRRIRDFIDDLQKEKKYQFPKKKLPQLKHFFE